MKAEIKEITPEMAQEIVDNKYGTRPIDWSHVGHLACLMSEGEWVFNGDAICLSDDCIIDGQHRLHAIVKSGKTIQALVLEDPPMKGDFTYNRRKKSTVI